jgi:hypothetical protein
VQSQEDLLEKIRQLEGIIVKKNERIMSLEKEVGHFKSKF